MDIHEPIKKQGSPIINDADSTDVSKLGSPGEKDAFGVTRPSIKDGALYDWSEVAYLFEDGKIP